MRLIEAAGYDEFQSPYVGRVIGYRADLLFRLTIYRGGTGAPADLATGLSWTTDVRFAVWYARRRHEQTGGAPGVEAEVPSCRASTSSRDPSTAA